MEHTNHDTLGESGATLYANMRELGPSSEELESQRAIFVDVVENAAKLYPNPDQRMCILASAGIFDWFHFGTNGDVLPPGLVKVMDDETKTIGVQVDERVIARGDVARAWGLFESLGADKLTDSLSTRAGSDTLVPDIEAVGRATEGHKLVESLTSAPPELQENRPLPLWMRAVRESQINAEVRGRYSIGDREAIPKRSPADLAIRRALFHLDEETIPVTKQKEKEADDPLARVRQYFAPIILEELRNNANPKDKSKIAHFRYDVGNGSYIGLASPDDADDDSVYGFESYNFLLTHYVTLRRPGGYNIDEPFEGSYLEMLCNEAHGSSGLTYEERLAEAMDSMTAYARDVFHNDPKTYGSYREDSFQEDVLSLRAFLRQTAGATIYKSHYEAATHQKEALASSGIEFLSQQEIQNLESRSIGPILRYDAAAYSDPRLIQVSPRTSNLVRHDKRAELVFDFWEELPVETEPYIPGFVAVSHDPERGRWGFVPDPEGDPYAEANMVVPRDNAGKLAAIYEEIGLTGLAHELRASNMTVADLVARIQTNTTYVIPAKNLNNPYTSSIKDFKSYVRNGKLQLQCTGSGIFLKRSLEMAFGEGCAAIQKGYVLPARSSVINAARHVQVSFTYRGQTYLLDATGGSRFGGSGSSSGNFLKRLRRKNHRQAPSLALSRSQPQKIPVDSEEGVIDISDEQLQHNKQTFEQQLINIYRCTDKQELYEHLAKLSEDDPIRRAVSVTMKPDAPIDTVQSALKYVEAIMVADDEILERMRLLPYKKHPILSIAQDALRHVISAREGQITATP